MRLSTRRTGLDSAVPGRKPALSKEVEDTLESVLRKMGEWGYPLSRKEVIALATDYCKLNELKVDKLGEDWFRGFMTRHSTLTLKKPELLQSCRAKQADPVVIADFFRVIAAAYQEIGLYDEDAAIQGDFVWNADETGFFHDPRKTKGVDTKGTSLTRQSQGSGRESTTVLACVSASGRKMPPLIIYRGKNFWDSWTSPDAYPGTNYAVSENGWMNSHIFLEWFKNQFVPHVKNIIGEGKKAVLLYDGHVSHVTIELILCAMEADIVLVKLPPHTSHILQPLDKGVFGPLKTAWDHQLVSWGRISLAGGMPKAEFAKQLGSVWRKIGASHIKAGYRGTGIFDSTPSLCNQNAIAKSAFHPANLAIANNLVPPVDNSTFNLEASLRERNQQSFPEDAGERSTLEKRGDTSKLHSANAYRLPRTKQAQLCMSFEDLLLQKIQKTDASAVKRRKVAPSRFGEILTHEDVLERMKSKKK
jgi:hypothetical protein